jgi:hypothetical protein
MKKLMLVAAVLWLAGGLSGCDTSGWGNSLGLLLKDVCSGSSNCYAQCPDGRRTNPNDPYCPGEPASHQPSRF